MTRSIVCFIFGGSALAMSSCACVERGNHSIRKMWVDYNTLRCPAMYFEQVDHLPYTAAKVGYFNWQYNKDPGHQLAALGKFTPPNCKACDDPAVPKGDEPFAYQVLYPSAVPGRTEQLWGGKLPEPVNVAPGTGNAEAPPDGAGKAGANGPAPAPPWAPNLPPAPPASNDLQLFAPKRPATSTGPEKLPSFEVPPPPSQPLDENVPPLQGPGSATNPDVHLTSGQAARSNPASSESSEEWAR